MLENSKRSWWRLSPDVSVQSESERARVNRGAEEVARYRQESGRLI